MKRLQITLLTFSIAVSAVVIGQGLTLDQAIDYALAHNYAIMQTQNTVVMQENLADRGQAGQLPTVSASGSLDLGLDNTRVQFLGNPDINDINWAASRNLNGSIKADYTLFNGLMGKYNFDKLNTNVELTQAQADMQIENTLMQVANAFFNVLRTKSNLEALTQTLDISRDRIKLAEYKKELSGGSQLNYLTAKVDFNKDSVDYLNALKAKDDADLELKFIMGKDLQESLALAEDYDINKVMNLETLQSQMLAQNPEYNSAKLNEQVSLLDYKISKSAYSPKLNISTSYGYNSSQSAGGFLALNQSDGLGLALSLSIPIYNGGKNQNAVQNTVISQENNALKLKETELTLQKNLLKAYTDYQNALRVLDLETENIETSELNFNYTNELYKSGRATSIDFRQAQINLLLANNNLNNLRYNAKLSEIELLRLTGRLLPQN